MRKLLQVLTVLLLILSGVSLFLGSLLFARRELLKGRTQALEKGFVQISALIEAEVDLVERPNTFPERDISEISDRLIPDPERATFWDEYPLHLEEPDQPFVSIRREELMQYYRRTPVTGEIIRDAYGNRETTGEGTMDETLKKIISGAQTELDRLNQTRHQLRRVREELIATIEELNSDKQRLRQALAQITDLNGIVAGLRDDVRRLENKVANLEDEIRGLNDDIAALKAEIEELHEEIRLRDETIAQQRDTIEKLRLDKPGAILPTGYKQGAVEAGRKGQVVSVNRDWTYVVLELNDQCLREIEGIQETMAKNNIVGIPTLEMFLKRGDKFVTKIRIVQIKKDEKLAIADVLVDWQQMPVEAGDVAFF